MFQKKPSKIIVILFLTFFLISTNMLVYQEPAQAFTGVDDAVLVAWLATAAIGAGAVGTVIANGDGTYSGTLHDFANTSLLNMSQDMKDRLKIALGTAYSYGYMKIQDVTGLWDYLHSRFLGTDSIVPVSTSVTPELLFNSNVRLGFSAESGAYGHGWILLFSGSTSLMYLDMGQWIPNGTTVTSAMTANATPYWYNTTLTASQRSAVESWAKATAVGGAFWSSTILWNGSTAGATGSWPVSLPTGGIDTFVDDGTEERPIAIPQNLTDLNNWDGTTAIPTTGALDLTAVPTDTMVGEVATTVSPTTTAEWEGTIEQGVTGALEADTTDTINFEPLKMVGNSFTKKFPFSLPWDLQNAVLGLGSGAETAPVWTVTFPASPWTPSYGFDIDLSFFDSVVPAIRAGELFVFTISLVFATRKLLGGDV